MHLKAKILLIILSILGSVNAFCQPQIRVRWWHCYDINIAGRNAGLNDIYRLGDGSLISCGYGYIDGNSRVAWILKTDNNGEFEWDQQYLDGTLLSIIETDDGGFASIGITDPPENLFLIRTDASGDTIWTKVMSEGVFDRGYGIIELKNGSLAVCGAGFNPETQGIDGVLASFHDDGDLNWWNFYGGDDHQYLVALRETDGGIVSGGWSVVDQKRPYVIKTDFNGRTTWERTYPQQGDHEVIATSLATTGDGGFFLGGRIAPVHNGMTQGYLLRIDAGGRVVWDRSYEINLGNPPRGALGFYCIARMPDGGIVATGLGEAGRGPIVVRFDRDGDEIWRSSEVFGDHRPSYSSLTSVVVAPDGVITAGGFAQNDEVDQNAPARFATDGLIVTFCPEVSSPVIIDYSPDIIDFNVIQNDTVTFTVYAIDEQEDSLYYDWFINEELSGSDTISTFIFGFLGDYEVRCIVSDITLADSITWHVTVTDLYVSAFTPDTLALAIRRGESLDFTLDTVRAVPGDPVDYLWLKRRVDIVDEVDTTGRDAGATIDFMQSGHYRVDGMAYRGESSDVVSWDVSVRGVIWAFAPEELAFEVLPDSLVSFVVEPTFPDAEGQTIQWLVDGEVVSEDTTHFEWSLSRADLNPPYLTQVQVVVADTVEADTVTWDVIVRNLEVLEKLRITNYELRMEASPNPFNSMLTISFAAINGGKQSLIIFDLSGREVAEFNGKWKMENGNAADHGGAVTAERTFVWNASSVPAGVYFVRLQSGSEIATKKVVLMR